MCIIGRMRIKKAVAALVRDGGAAALQQTEQESIATKMLRNGQLYIQRGEQLFNVLGAMAE